MTPLADLLIARIRATGPINIAEFMSECLLHPKHGYYSTRDPFGQAGDFTTAPEISQMFGELLGLSLAQCWLDQGSPTPFVLAELGPGRGTLMADVMRATQKVTGFHSAAQLHLIEASKHLRKVQRETLAGLQPVWLDHVVKLPDAPLFLLANEFFDALPIRQFTRHTQGWQEHLVTAGDGTLAFALSEPGNIARLEHRLDDTKSGDIVEVCEPAGPIVTEVAAKISEHGGAAIVVDYGGWHSLGDTLQALRNHEYENPLAQPGQADLTAHVDFEALGSQRARRCCDPDDRAGRAFGTLRCS